MEKDDTSRWAVRTEKTEACSEQSFESACLCWLWGKQRERNHLKKLSVFVSDLLSQGKAENHVVEVRKKPWSPQAGNFTQHGPNTPVWKRWSGWMPWKWEEDKHITTSVIGLGDAEGEYLRSLEHGGWWHRGSVVFVKTLSSPLARSPMQSTLGNICSRGVSSWTKFQGQTGSGQWKLN